MSVGRRFLFSVFSIFLWFHTVISKSDSDEFCNNTQSTNGCCNNFYRINGTCTKCPNGTFGQNCSNKCLPNMFGEFCLQKCHCKNNEECNSTRGCIIPEAYCSDLESPNVRCCSNYILSDGVCKECAPGTYNANCTDECPEGFYGLFCAERCTCQGHCDKVFGCSVPISPTNQWVYWCFPTVSGIIIFICTGFAYLRWKRKHSKSRNFAGFDVQTFIYNVDEAEGDMDNLMIGPFKEVFDNVGYQAMNLSRYNNEEPVKSTTLTNPSLETSSLAVGHSTELAGEEIHISSSNNNSSLGIKKSKNDYSSGSVDNIRLLSCVNAQEELSISNAEQPFEIYINENNSPNLEDKKFTELAEETFNYKVNKVTAGGDVNNIMIGPSDELPDPEGYQTMTFSRYNYEEPIRSKLLTKSLGTPSLAVTHPTKLTAEENIARQKATARLE